MRLKSLAAAMLIAAAASGAYANEITDFSVNGDGILNVNGSISGEEKINLFVNKAEDSSAKGIIAIKQLCSENGKYSFSVNLEEALSTGGKYRFHTVSQTEDAAYGEFEYYTKAERRRIAGQINSISGENRSEAIRKIIEDNTDLLSFACPEFKTLVNDGKSEAAAEFLSNETVTENNLLSVINKTTAIITTGVSKDEAEIKNIFEKYESDMQLESSKFYAGLSDKNALYKELAKNEVVYKNASEFYKLFDMTVILADVNSARGTDGMYEVLIKYPDTFDMTTYNLYDNDKTAMLKKLLTEIENGGIQSVERINEILGTKIAKSAGQSSGSSGGSKGSTGSTYTAPSQPTVSYNEKDTVIPENVFTDLEGCEWAKEEIEMLASLNILNGVGQNVFAPYENVTRAQICKMICKILNIEPKNGISVFEDVTENDWFCGYVNALSENGIVFGVSTTEFKPNEDISRQDFAVMLHRALGTSVPEKNDEFTDFEKIAEYAEDAAAALKAEGIIKGDISGSFNPEKNTNRAEAAVMIYRSYKYLNGGK